MCSCISGSTAACVSVALFHAGCSVLAESGRASLSKKQQNNMTTVFHPESLGACAIVGNIVHTIKQPVSEEFHVDLGSPSFQIPHFESVGEPIPCVCNIAMLRMFKNLGQCWHIASGYHFTNLHRKSTRFCCKLLTRSEANHQKSCCLTTDPKPSKLSRKQFLAFRQNNVIQDIIWIMSLL